MITSLGVVSSVRHSRHGLNCGAWLQRLRCVVQCRLSGSALVCCQRGVGAAHRRRPGRRLERRGIVAAMAVGIAIASFVHRNLARRPSRCRLHSDDSGCLRRQGNLGAVCHYDAAFDHHQWTLIAAIGVHRQYFARDIYYGGPWSRNRHPHHSAARA